MSVLTWRVDLLTGASRDLRAALAGALSGEKAAVVAGYRWSEKLAGGKV